MAGETYRMKKRTNKGPIEVSADLSGLLMKWHGPGGAGNKYPGMRGKKPYVSPILNGPYTTSQMRDDQDSQENSELFNEQSLSHIKPMSPIEQLGETAGLEAKAIKFSAASMVISRAITMMTTSITQAAQQMNATNATNRGQLGAAFMSQGATPSMAEGLPYIGSLARGKREWINSAANITQSVDFANFSSSTISGAIAGSKASSYDLTRMQLGNKYYYTPEVSKYQQTLADIKAKYEDPISAYKQSVQGAEEDVASKKKKFEDSLKPDPWGNPINRYSQIQANQDSYNRAKDVFNQLSDPAVAAKFDQIGQNADLMKGEALKRMRLEYFGSFNVGSFSNWREGAVSPYTSSQTLAAGAKPDAAIGGQQNQTMILEDMKTILQSILDAVKLNHP
jgi:hypothetical protein